MFVKILRDYTNGGLCISEMHRNYFSRRSAENKPAANYDTYARIFNSEFNIGFYFPKKNQYHQCEAYKNATGEEKLKLEELHNQHLGELCRDEKTADIELAKQGKIHLAAYDLQAVLPVPVGQTSYFFKNQD
jgi:hypothetical protein